MAYTSEKNTIRFRQKINYLRACVQHILSLGATGDSTPFDHVSANISGVRTSGAMVSTRQMSNVGASASGEAEQARGTRHATPAGGSSPQQQSTVARYALPPPPRLFTTNLMDLPVEILEKILRLLGYKSVSQIRLVNRQLNTVCSSILNSTFHKLQNQMLHRFHTIKSKMPRRESARRSHPLACESDIIETLHMRLSLLQMTFGKHIERKHCCFFPGDILDEVYSILSYLKTTTKLARPYKVTDELFDLTTMAMEYFKEHIEPNLPEITYFGTDFFDITNTFSPGESSKSYICLDSPPPAGMEPSTSRAGAGPSGEHRPPSLNYLEESLPPSPPPPQSNMVLRKRIHRIKQGMKKYNDQLSALRSDLRSCKRKTAIQQKQISEQQKQLAEQQKQTMEYANRLDDYDKKNEETSRKFQTLLQELNKCKTELQYWRSRSPAAPPLCAECGVAVALASSPDLPASLQWVVNGNADILEAVAGGSGEPSAADVATTGAVEPAPEKAAAEKAAPAEAEVVATSTPPTRRRPSAENGPNNTPERKKRRLTRPRKL